MANKSMYTDRANKATSRAKGDFVFTQKGDGTEASKGTEVEVLLASNLDDMDTGNVLAFNPTAGSIPIANSDNTKAYNGELAKISSSNYATMVDINAGTKYGTIADSDSLDFGVNDFTIAIKIDSLANLGETFIDKGDNTYSTGFSVKSESTGAITFRNVNGASVDTLSSNTGTLIIGNNYSIIVKRSGTSLLIKCNNILVAKGTATGINVSSTYGTRIATNQALAGTQSQQCKYGRITFLNYSTTDEEDNIIYNSGRPDRAILPDYMKWGSNVNLIPTLDFTTEWIPGNAGTSSKSSNSFTTPGLGGLYMQGLLSNVANYNIKIRIKNTVTVAITETGNQAYTYNIPPSSEYITYNFLYTGRTTSNSNSDFYIILLSAGTCDVEILDITQAGAIADLEPSGIVCNSSGKVTAWTDSSTNDNDATVTGTPDLVLVKAEEFEGKGMNTNEFIFKTLDASAGANVGDVLFLPPQWSIVRCIAYNYGTSSANIKLGSTSGGGEYVSSKTISVGELVNFNVPDTKDPYSITDFLPMYLNSASWGTAKVKVRFVLMHVPWGE